MTIRTFILAIIFSGFVTSCSKEDEKNEKETSIPFFELKDGDYWKYHVRNEEYDDVTGDNTYYSYSRTITVGSDTLINNIRYKKIGNAFYRHENGNYYKLSYSNHYTTGMGEIIYFKDGLKPSDSWKDTILTTSYPNIEVYFFKVVALYDTFSVDSILFDDVVKLCFNYHISSDYTQYYSKGIGLIEEKFSAPFISERRKLVEHNK